MNNLIFDIGCHTGEESDFYLRKGFEVVAVEANPALCAILRQKFAAQIGSGQFHLVEKAIAERAGEVSFFFNKDVTIWGTIRENLADRYGMQSDRITVPAVTFGSLVEQFGIPYYMKVDIEGADQLCLEGLAQFHERPRFVSFESEVRSWPSLHAELARLKSLGYKQFQIVDQKSVVEQKPPTPPREGSYADYTFEFGSAGLFGDELPGRWKSYGETLAEFGLLFARHRLHGIARRVGPLKPLAERYPTSWYDTHARLS
jgi:FkbM family methyltransferase